MGKQAGNNKMENESQEHKKDKHYVHMFGMQEKHFTKKGDKDKQGPAGIKWQRKKRNFLKLTFL